MTDIFNKKSEKVQWCLDQHSSTNHFYDRYLPYEFHLRMVVQVAKNFIELVKDSNDGEEPLRRTIIYAAWGHDLIEDTRTSYNDVKEVLGHKAADIIYAVSNEKGKTRKERANDKYYQGIRETEGAVYVKLCDRIANVQYSKMTKSRMFEMYKKENENFMIELGWSGSPTHQYAKMFFYLQDLFKED